jgi:hypothetical protein
MLAASLLSLLALSATVPEPVHAEALGSPWISIELPANPLNARTRDAYLLVHTYYHSTIARMPLTGTATGIMDGKRQVLPLRFEETGLVGVMAVKQTWPAQGTWVLAINGGGDNGPTALVGIGDGGKVRSVDVPTQTRGSDTWGRKVTERDIDNTLKEVAAADGQRDRNMAYAGLALLAVGLVGKKSTYRNKRSSAVQGL